MYKSKLRYKSAPGSKSPFYLSSAQGLCVLYVDYSFVQTPQHLPLDQLHHDEVTTISRVVKYQAIRTGGLKLEEKMHGSIGLQGREGQVAGLC